MTAFQATAKPDGLCDLVQPGGRYVLNLAQQYRRPEAGPGDGMVQHKRTPRRCRTAPVGDEDGDYGGR